MKKILLILSLGWTSAFAFDVQTTLVCESPAKMIQSLNDAYGEEPYALFHNSEDRQETVLTVNPKTASWTLVLVAEKAKLACIIASGKDFDVRPPKSRKAL